MFKDAIGTGKRDDPFKSVIFGVGILVIKISVAGLVIFGITYLSDKLNPQSAPPKYSMDTNKGL